MTSRTFSRSFTALGTGAFFALSLAVISTPARALDDDGRGNTFNSLLNMFGMGPAEESDAIQYRERAPLVVPGKSELRTPRAQNAARTADWPQDQEVVKARRRTEEARRRAPRDAAGNEIVTAGEMTKVGRISRSQQTQGPEDCDNMNPAHKGECSPETFWKMLATKRAGDTDVPLQAGVEPDRKYLTQPPRGYMAATKGVKATFEPVTNDEPSPLDYYRSKPKRDE